MAVRQFGVVRFDRDDPNGGGWCAVEGAESSRVPNAGSLDSNTLWWSNLSWRAMHSANIHRVPYIKRTSYLHSWRRDQGMEAFCESWGLIRRSYSEKARTEALALVFGQVMRMIATHYGISLKSNEVFAYDNVADELRARMIPDPDPALGPEVDGAISDSHLYYSICMTPYTSSEDYVDVAFARPAVAYAREMTQVIVPTDQAEYVDATRLPSRSGRIDWALAQERPVLARVTVSHVHPDYANIISFGNGARAGSNRSWLTQPEILLLSKFARMEIEAAYLFGGYRSLSTACALPSMTDLQSIMPTTQLWATNHWIGLCRENPYRLEPGGREQRRTSPRAAWMTAVDRFLMFTSALQLHEAGIAVRSYGAGTVVASVPKYNYRDAYEVAKSVGLLAPTTMAEDIDVQEDMHAVR